MKSIDQPHEGSAKVILEIANVDFALYHFVAPLMQALEAQGHRVVGACAPGQFSDLMCREGLRVEPIAMVRSYAPLRQLRAFIALVKLIRRLKPDIVHAHMPISGLLARWAAWYCGVPHIAYTCHGYLFHQPGSLRRRTLSFVLEWLTGKITTTYLTVSREEARDARRLWINRTALPVLNGRDPRRFTPDRAKRAHVRAQLGVALESVVIIIVSRLVRHKGYPELLVAMEHVPEAELWVVGDRLSSDHGDAMDDVFARARHNLGARFRLLGYREDVNHLLAAADIFTLPSHFEGLPMSIVEAMLCGLPVVATNIRGPREQVLEGQTGYLVAPNNAEALAEKLGRLVSDPELRCAMGVASLARARALYTEEACLERTLDAILS